VLTFAIVIVEKKLLDWQQLGCLLVDRSVGNTVSNIICRLSGWAFGEGSIETYRGNHHSHIGEVERRINKNDNPD
jgi:hypothetical protein